MTECNFPCLFCHPSYKSTSSLKTGTSSPTFFSIPFSSSHNCCPLPTPVAALTPNCGKNSLSTPTPPSSPTQWHAFCAARKTSGPFLSLPLPDPTNLTLDRERLFTAFPFPGPGWHLLEFPLTHQGSPCSHLSPGAVPSHPARYIFSIISYTGLTSAGSLILPLNSRT